MKGCDVYHMASLSAKKASIETSLMASSDSMWSVARRTLKASSTGQKTMKAMFFERGVPRNINALPTTSIYVAGWPPLRPRDHFFYLVLEKLGFLNLLYIYTGDATKPHSGRNSRDRKTALIWLKQAHPDTNNNQCAHPIPSHIYQIVSLSI
jgi:hypothetical protein